MMRHRLIDARKAEGFPVQATCRVVDVAPSSSSDWCAKVAAGRTETE